MKTLHYIIAVLCLGLLSGCGAQKGLRQEAEAALFTGDVTPQQITEHDGKAGFDYMLKLPPKAFRRTMVVKITPVLKYGKTELRLDSIILQGQGVANAPYQVVKYKEGFELTRHYEFPYRPGMEHAVLTIESRGNSCGKRRWFSEAVVNAKGIRSQHYQQSEHADLTGEIRGIVMFPMSKSTILSGQDYMKYLRSNLDTVMAYPGAVITGIQLLVSCSPDGEATFNKELADMRNNEAMRYFERQLGLANYEAYRQPGIVTRQLTVQNWQGLYDLIEDSHIDVRYDIIKKLKSVPDPEREKLLVTYMNRYPVVKNEYLPLLRNAQIIIYYKMPWHKIKPTVFPGWW